MQFDGHTAFSLFALVVAVACLAYNVGTGRKTKRMLADLARRQKGNP